MSPAPAVREPHANRLSVSQPVDMHAHAIITAPMTNTKSEPIANLRIQGIVSSNSRSGSAAPTTRLRRPTSANQLIRSLSFPRESCDRSCWCFSIRNKDGISSPGTTRWILFFLQSDSALLNAVSSLAPMEMIFGLSPLTFKPTTLQSSSLNKTDMSKPPPLNVMFEVA